MRLAQYLAAVALFTTPPAYADVHIVQSDDREFSVTGLNSFEADDARFEIDDDEIIITHLKAPKEEIRITPSYQLFIDDQLIPLDPEQQRTVEEFYNLSFQIRDEAKLIAKDGVRVGLKGAGVGIKAIGCVLKMLFTGYTEEDLDRDMEHAADKIEAEADKLEVRAEKLEDIAERWKDLGIDMRESIPQLAAMDWL